MGENGRARRGMAMAMAFLILIIVFVGAVAINGMRRSLRSSMSRFLAGYDLELVALEALDEAHYKLVMAHPPAYSAGPALEEIAAARNLGPGSDGPRSFDLPDRDLVPDRLDHDSPTFLASEDRSLYFAPVTVASSLGRASRILLEPVEVRVLIRESTARKESPYRGDGEPTQAELRELGLPPGIDTIRRTWGIVESRCQVRMERGLLGGVFRGVIRRHLFSVAEYTPAFGTERSFAYVFPQPIAQMVNRV